MVWSWPEKESNIGYGFCILVLSSLISVRAQQQQPMPPAPLPNDVATALKIYKRRQPEAMELLGQAIKRYARDADTLYAIGLALHREGIEYFVRDIFERVVLLQPEGYPEAHAILASLQLLTNNLEKATSHAKRALSADVRSAEMNYVIGEAAYRQHEYAKALLHAEEALKVTPAYPQAVLLKSQALAQKDETGDAIKHLESFLALAPDDPDSPAWRKHLETVLASVDKGAANLSPEAAPNPIYKFNQTDKKAVLILKPEPGYTEEARRYNVQGTVRLRVVLSSDGQVKDLYIVQSLSHGLTFMAMQAVLKIKFVPAMKDGRPVSQFATIEYSFNLI